MIPCPRPLSPFWPPLVRRGGAFTLVELLVVMVVLTLLMLMLTQLTNNAAMSIGVGTRQVEVDGAARLVLDRIAFDLAGMLRRTDIDYTFERQTGSGAPMDDFLSFYTEGLSGTLTTATSASPGASPASVPRTAILLGLRINTGTDPLTAGRLERGTVNLGATGITFAPMRNNVYAPFFQTPNTLPVAPAPTALTDADYRVLGDQVFRFEFCFLCNDPATGKVALHASLPDKAGLDDIKALVIAIAVLDTRGRTHMTAAQLKILHDGLRDYTDADTAGAAPARDIAAIWTDAVNNAGYGAGVPNNIRAAVRVYQRYYYLR